MGLRPMLLLAFAASAWAAEWSFGVTYAGHEWSGSRRQWEFGSVSVLPPPFWLGPAVSVWTGTWLDTPLPCSLETVAGGWRPSDSRVSFNSWLPVGVRFVPLAVVRRDGYAPAYVEAGLRYCGWTEVKLSCRTDRLEHYSAARGHMLDASAGLSSSLVAVRFGYQRSFIPRVQTVLAETTGYRQFAFPSHSLERYYVGFSVRLDVLFVDSPGPSNRAARLLLPPLFR